jgi:hypothetical protein
MAPARPPLSRLRSPRAKGKKFPTARASRLRVINQKKKRKKNYRQNRHRQKTKKKTYLAKGDGYRPLPLSKEKKKTQLMEHDRQRRLPLKRELHDSCPPLLKTKKRTSTLHYRQNRHH